MRCCPTAHARLRREQRLSRSARRRAVRRVEDQLCGRALRARADARSVYAPPGEDPDLNTWNALINAGEPYQEATIGPIADAVTSYRSGYYWLDPAVEPAPTLFNSGWSDDIFPVTEPVRWIQRAKYLHPGLGGGSSSPATTGTRARASVDAGRTPRAPCARGSTTI